MNSTNQILSKEKNEGNQNQIKIKDKKNKIPIHKEVETTERTASIIEISEEEDEKITLNFKELKMKEEVSKRKIRKKNIKPSLLKQNTEEKTKKIKSYSHKNTSKKPTKYNSPSYLIKRNPEQVLELRNRQIKRGNEFKSQIN